MSLSNKKSLSEEEIKNDHPDIYESLLPLLRTKVGGLDAYLETVACDVNINSTNAVAHCYFITLDGNKRPRVNDFVRFISERITDFAIPRSEVAQALNESLRTGSTAPVNRINNKARKLFTQIPKSGEGGEVLLSILAETFLHLPQMFTKMVLKTSTDMHVHGCDGVHVGINKKNNNLTIYWGESKLHSNATQATAECFDSLAPFLLDAGGANASQERDLQLMRDGIDFNDPTLEKCIKKYLDPDNTLHKNLEYRGLCLIGFDSDAYPVDINSKEIMEVKNDVEKVFEKRKKHIEKRLKAEKINSFKIQVFCLPFPSVENFRKAFREAL